MKTESIYTCEICGFQSYDMEEVKRCEAKGEPKNKPTFDPNVEVTLYGRNGDVTAKITGVRVVNKIGYAGSHAWLLELDRYAPTGDSDWGRYAGYEENCAWPRYLLSREEQAERMLKGE